MEQCAECKLLSIIMKCDTCKIGEMIADPNGTALMTTPPQFVHKCNNCGAEAYYPNCYPTQIAISVEPYRDFNEEEKKALGITSTNIIT